MCKDEAKMLKNRLKYGQYIVLYFDLMGVKENLFKGVRGHCSVVDCDQLQKIDKSMSVVADFVKAMRNLFRIYRENAGAIFDEMTEGVNHPMRDRDRQIFIAECQNLEIGIQQGSDTVWVYVRDDDTFAVARIVWDLLLDLALAIVNGLTHDVSVRGCLARGTAWQPYDGCLFGPVFKEADDIEKKVADYPRIVVTEWFTCFCERMLNRMSPDVVAAEDSLIPFAMIRSDVDGFDIFDFADPKCAKAWDAFMQRQHPGEKSPFSELLQHASKWATEQRQSYQMSGNEKLLSKYLRLENYLKSRMA